VKRKTLIFLLLAGLCLSSAFAQVKKPLTNEDVVQMVKAGFEEAMIVKAIQANDSAFDVSLPGLLALKSASVSQVILDAMLAAEAKKKEAPSSNGKPQDNGTAAPAEKPSSGSPSSNPAVYIEEVSSSGGIVASSDTALEAMKTLQKRGVRVVTKKEKADYVVQITRQLGKKSWSKDTKIVMSNRDGEVVMSNSTRSIGGACDDIAEYIYKHHEAPVKR
jgi:hypothetical protein